MKKKIIALGATILGVLAAGINPVFVEAETTKENDTFVFDASTYNLGQTFQKTKKVKSSNNVTLYMGAAKGTIKNVNFSEDSYFTKALYSANVSSPIYTLSASKGTKVGVYYSLTDAKGNVNDNNSLEMNYSSYEWWDILKWFPNENKESVDLEEKANNVYYSEFTFTSGDIKLNTSNQYLWLYGVTLISNEEINNRNEANDAIENLLNYYANNGLSTNEEFKSLIDDANNAVASANHVSRYDEYLEVVSLYNELVKVEDSINTLVDVNPVARGINTVIKYDAESKALLDKVGNDIEVANEKGISNDMISNYEIYLAAVNKYNSLESLYNESAVVNELINNLADATYTSDYKNELDNIENELNNLSSFEFVSNYDEFEAKKNAFDELSNEAINAFVAKVNEANEVKGETASYVLINEAEELYNNLIASDKNNESVVNALNTLNDVKNAYSEMEENVTENTFAFKHGEDGLISKIYFIGTINNFVACSDLSKITIFVTNDMNDEELIFDIKTVYTSVKISGNMICDKIDGVRYINASLLNEENIYEGYTFSMYYELIYKDGHKLTSSISTVEVM